MNLKKNLPYIVVLTNPTTGGVTASWAMLGDVLIAEPKATIGFAGRRVIQDTVRETLPEEFQTAEYVKDHGGIDLVVERKYLNSTIGTLLNVLLKKQKLKLKLGYLMSKSINLYNQLARNNLFKKTINFNLKRIKLVLKKLGHPEKKLKNVINIIGSDGKFSVLTSLKFFIEANNQKTSAFISPSLKDIRDRFWTGKSFLSYKEISNTIRLISKQNINLTTFEVLTVIFILNAAKRNNHYNLIEAGALFAKDSTNVFDFPKLQVVVNINKQHLNFVKKKI